MESGKLFVKKVANLICLKTFEEYNADLCDMEVIKRIGHYVLFPLTTFGRYKEQFEIIKTKSGRISFLVSTPELWKSTQISALMLISKLKYTILKKQNTD